MTKLPLFSTVNGVMFPNTSQYFTIRRDFSVASVKEAVAKFNNQLLIATQKSISRKKPAFDDIYTTGCLCTVTNMIELPDGDIKFSAFAERRFKISNLVDEGVVRYGLGKEFEEPTRSNEIPSEVKESLLQKLKSLDLDLEDEEYEMLKNLKSSEDDYTLAMHLGYFAAKTQIKMREPTIEEINKGLYILDLLTEAEKKSVDQGMANMLEILESSNFPASIKKMEKYLA